MNLLRTLSSAALVAAAVSGCAPPRAAGGDGAALTQAEATDAMLVAGELPGEWRTTAVSVRPGRSVHDSATSGSECGQATHELAEEASRWGAADVNVEAAWETPDRDMLLKQEIASDRDLEAGRLADLLGRQVRDCSDVVVATDEVTVESHIRACGLSRGETGLQIVQSWTASNGGAGSTRLAYIVGGHNLVVLTFTSADTRASCEHTVFDSVVAAAVTKAAQ